MLIMTTNVFLSSSQMPLVSNWSGPLVLVVLPGSGIDRTAIEALNQTFVILDFLQPPAGAARLFADVVGWLGHLLRQRVGPVLFLDRPLDAEILSTEAARGMEQPERIHAELDQQGRLTLLRLGEMVASSPLLPGLFDFLNRRTVNDALFVDLLTHAFPSPTA